MSFSSLFLLFCTFDNAVSPYPESSSRQCFYWDKISCPTGQRDSWTSSKSCHGTHFKFHVISDQGVYWSTQYFNAIFSIQLLSFKRKLLMLAEVGQNFSSLIPGQLEARQCSGMVVVWWEPPSQESMYEQKVILYKSWFELSMHIWIFFTSFIMKEYISAKMPFSNLFLQME